MHRKAAPNSRHPAPIGILASLVLAACLAFPSLGHAAPANFAGASADGKVIFFTTLDKLVPGDTDDRLDVYERSFDPVLESYVTREISTGPTGGNDAFQVSYNGSTADGTKAFFSTAESLVAADTDHADDIYLRDLGSGTTTLLTSGAASCSPSCGNGPGAAIFFDASSDGSRVDFVTDERLASADTDNSIDVYERAGGVTTLVSQGAAACAPACGNGADDSIFQGASADGTEVVFTTTEQLAAGDTDNLGDLYARNLTTGTTVLVSAAGVCPSLTDCTPAFGAASADGSRIFFETNERLKGADTDSSSDLYEWAGGTIALVSTGPVGGNGTANATYEANASGGAAVFFETSEKLVAADTDSAIDVYERTGGATSLISTGPAGGSAESPATLDKVSTDGATALFSSAESMVTEDTDSTVDVYARAGGSTALVSIGPGTGNGNFGAGFAGASSDATHVLFETAEPLLAQDGDARADIYERTSAGTTLVSNGPVGHDGPFDPNLSDVAVDGSHAVFITEERLTEGDLDTERDVYDFSGSGTLLVSVGNSVQLGPPTPALTGTNPASPNSSTTPAVVGQAEAGTSIKLYASLDCSGAPVGTGSSLQLATTGIGTAVAVGSITTFRATATDGNGDTSACSSSSVVYRQQDVAPPGEEGGGSGGGSGGGTGGGSGTVTGSTPVGGGQKPSGGGGGDGRSTPGALSPRTKVTFAPLFKTHARRPVIGFVDDTGQEGTTFSCRVDRRPWAKCASPYKLKKLSLGRHAFRVKGVNSGIWETLPVVRKFKVVSR
jgi:hypothetical protein